MANNSLAVQQIPHLKSAPFRSRVNLSYSHTFTMYPDLVMPVANIKGEVGDTLDISIDLKLLMLYLQGVVLDALQVDVYAFYTKYSQVYNKYTRVRGENLSVNSDDRTYTMSKVTSTYPVVSIYRHEGDNLKNYASALKWKQNGREMVPMVFDTTTGKMIDPVITMKDTTVPGQRVVAGSQYIPHWSDPDYANMNYCLGFLPGSLPDALGCNCGMPCMAYSAAPFVAYYLICDYYFRNAEIFDSIVGLVPDVDVNRPWNIWSEWQGMVADTTYPYGSVTKFFEPMDYVYLSDTLTSLAPGGFYRVSRKPDYLSLGLASPTYQGLEVFLPSSFSSTLPDTIPVVGNGLAMGLTDGNGTVGGLGVSTSSGSFSAYSSNYGDTLPGTISTTDGRIDNGKLVGLTTDPDKSGLVGVLSGSMMFDPGTVQETRTGFQMLKFLEAKNRAGKYFGDIIYNFFGIADPKGDTRFPEWIGLASGSFGYFANMQSSAAGATPQGNIAMNASCDINQHLCRKTFTEDGLIQIMVVVRQPSVVFQDRVDRSFFEFEELDFMNPLFAHLGDQPVYNHEVYVPAMNSEVFDKQSGPQWLSDVSSLPSDTEITADRVDVDKNIQDELDYLWQPNSYQERYADKKYAFNRVSGLFRSRCRVMQSFKQPLYSKYRWSDALQDYHVYGSKTAGMQVPLDNQLYTLSFDNPQLVGDAGIHNFVGRPGLTNFSSGHCPTRTEAQMSKSITPFAKQMFDVEYPPIQGQVYLRIIADRIVPVKSAPGLADHQ